jgi:hypothetical protein
MSVYPSLLKSPETILLAGEEISCELLNTLEAVVAGVKVAEATR